MKERGESEWRIESGGRAGGGLCVKVGREGERMVVREAGKVAGKGER